MICPCPIAYHVRLDRPLYLTGPPRLFAMSCCASSYVATADNIFTFDFLVLAAYQGVCAFPHPDSNPRFSLLYRWRFRSSCRSFCCSLSSSCRFFSESCWTRTRSNTPSSARSTGTRCAHSSTQCGICTYDLAQLRPNG